MRRNTPSFVVAALLPAAMIAAAAPAQQPFLGGPSLDAAIGQAVEDGLIPGAVLLIGHNGVVVYHKAYGDRALIPLREPMTEDTIFDAASLTKVVATTPCLMKLFEEGKLRTDDPVTRYLPEFQGGQSGITVRDLMTHFSGLRPDLDLDPPWHGYDTGIRKALSDVPAGPPGRRFVYSDINFILLGEIVHRLSGKMLNDYAREVVFEPLGMHDTMFLPPPALRRRIAPTEIDPATGKPLRGVVHDETSRDMGGVAGHAGLFTTAADLSRFARMMLGLGQFEGVRLFSPLTVRKFITPESPADQPLLRGFGWDIDSPYSGNRGELFPIGSFGHTGFTGTSVWMDPATDTYVILLTNSVHPHRGKNLTSLRGRVATIAAAALGVDVPGVALTGYGETILGAGMHRVVARNAATETGLDVLEDENFAPLRGKRVGLITNQTGVDRAGARNIDLMRDAGISITTLFSPEHGFAGSEDHPDVANSRDAASGIPIFSLYRKGAYRPSPESLRGLDALVFDIQDVGARFYTYSCTMIYALEASAKAHVPFFILDRPNPITGTHVEGPILDKDLESFTGCYELPLRHGMTLGEIAQMVNGERNWGADLHVIAMKDWQRGDWFDSTGLLWINPSPNMRNLNAAVLYPGLSMLEAGRNYSVGRGTGAPLEQIGADWLDGRKLAAFLNGRFLPGVRVYPTRFTPSSSNFSGRSIQGVRFVVTDREAVDSTRVGMEVAFALEKLYPGMVNWEANRHLIGNRAVIDALRRGDDPRIIQLSMESSVRDFLRLRRKYLIYR